MDIPQIFTITESAHRIHDPLTAEKLATLGTALPLEPWTVNGVKSCDIRFSRRSGRRRLWHHHSPRGKRPRNWCP